MAVSDNTAVLAFNPRAQMLRDLGYPGDPSGSERPPTVRRCKSLVFTEKAGARGGGHACDPWFIWGRQGQQGRLEGRQENRTLVTGTTPLPGAWGTQLTARLMRATSAVVSTARNMGRDKAQSAQETHFKEHTLSLKLNI